MSNNARSKFGVIRRVNNFILPGKRYKNRIDFKKMICLLKKKKKKKLRYSILDLNDRLEFYKVTGCRDITRRLPSPKALLADRP